MNCLDCMNDWFSRANSLLTSVHGLDSVLSCHLRKRQVSKLTKITLLHFFVIFYLVCLAMLFCVLKMCMTIYT